MTSTIKIGLVSLGIVGAGLGAFFVNRGLRHDGTSRAQSTEDNSQNTAPGESSVANASPQTDRLRLDTSTPAADPPDARTEHVASPAPLSVRDSFGDADRSWRPRPLETTEAGPPLPGPLVTEADADERDSTAQPGHVVDATPMAAAPLDVTPKPAPATVSDTPAGPSTPTYVSLRPTTLPAAGSPETPAPKQAPDKMTIHVVQSGDTLSALAVKYLGSAKHVNLIAKANPKVKPNRLYVGTKLNIPPAPATEPVSKEAGGTAASAQGSKTAGSVTDSSRAYTVKKGDEWPALGRRLMGQESAWTRLYEHNRDRFPGSSRALRPGMVLEIPPKPAAPKTQAANRTTSR